MQEKELKNRYRILYILLALLTLLVVQRLFSLQILEGENYRVISDSRLARNIPVKAPRGEILDRYGRPMITNRVGQTVAIAKIDDDRQGLNRVVFNLASLFDANALVYEDTFPVSKTEPFAFVFSGDSEEALKKKEAAFKKMYSFKENATAQEVVDKFRAHYQVADTYTPTEARKIIGVRYEMEMRNFSSNNPYVFANDVDISIVSQIKEQREEKYRCISVYQEPIRAYTAGTTAAHILGRVGIISQAEYAELKDKDYGMNDYIGKEGAEKAFESYLRGTDGTNSIERKFKEGESEIVYSRDPIPGDSVMLTIDLDLQKVAEESLKQNIQRIASNATTARGGGDANAGAVVVMDVNSGEILAMASYPTYDPSRYNQDYNKLLKANGNPIFNRALRGTYEPGSTFKLVTATAALEEGIITPTQAMETKGQYHYLSHTFSCNVFRTSGRTHGVINVSEALRDSCNYFFYDMGKQLGIDRLGSYAKNFGLGEYTGIELSEEVKGQLANPADREKTGRKWYPGDALQAAIGQSDNLFTPLQLANYVATVANGGTNYRAHLLKAVKSGTDQSIIANVQPEIRHKIEIKPENLNAVLKGMGMVTDVGGTASAAFSTFPIKTGGKTGSAQVSRGSANGLYVGFAPFDDPQIAVAIVVEHGASGSGVSPIARDIFEQYFYGGNVAPNNQTAKNELLP